MSLVAGKISEMSVAGGKCQVSRVKNGELELDKTHYYFFDSFFLSLKQRIVLTHYNLTI